MVSSSGRLLCTRAPYFMHYDIFVMGFYSSHMLDKSIYFF